MIEGKKARLLSSKVSFGSKTSRSARFRRCAVLQTSCLGWWTRKRCTFGIRGCVGTRCLRCDISWKSILLSTLRLRAKRSLRLPISSILSSLTYLTTLLNTQICLNSSYTAKSMRWSCLFHASDRPQSTSTLILSRSAGSPTCCRRPPCTTIRYRSQASRCVGTELIWSVTLWEGFLASVPILERPRSAKLTRSCDQRRACCQWPLRVDKLGS